MNRTLLRSCSALAVTLLATAGTAAAQDAAPAAAPATPAATDPAPTTVDAGVRTVTLEEAVDLAMKDNIQIDLGQDKIDVAEVSAKRTKTYRLPQLMVKGSLLFWNKEETVAFQPGAPPITMRNQLTGSVEVDVVEPVTTAVILGRMIELEDAGVDAARADLETAKLDVAYQVATTYLGVLQAQTLRDVAQTSVTQLEADLVKIRALVAAKVLSDVDVLRLEAARDQVKQGVLEASVGAQTALRGLALLLDLPDGTDLAVAPIDTTPPELGWTEDEAVAAAKAKRPEARAMRERAEQADIGIDVARSQYYPSVNAIASYTHSEQGGLFEIKDAAFIGLQLNWNVWDWGKRHDDVAEAKVNAKMAKRAQSELDDQLAFDVRSKWLTASAKRDSLAVAESALKAAEEAYRLQTAKINAGVATTTDVMDAESEVSRARAQATISRYQYLVAWIALVRAVGEVPNLSAAK